MDVAFRDLKTARQIARQSGVPIHKVDYVIQRLGLTETGRVGIVRLYSPEQVETIREALARIAARRTDFDCYQVEAVQ